jgi:hypothetical protein
MSRAHDWELERFVERANRLWQTRLIQNGFSVELSYAFRRRAPSLHTVEGRLTQPHEEVLESFLMHFRPFVLQREPVYLSRVYNQLDRRLTNTARRDALRASRERWRKSQRHLGLQFFIDDLEITPELVIYLYINGYHFHDDPDKRERLETLTVGHGQLLTRYVFLEALRATVPHVFLLAEITKESLADGSLAS